MYKNAGKNIKDIVKTVVGIQIFGYIVLALAIIFSYPSDTAFIFGMIVGGVGCFFAWLSGLILYAYGDIADNVKILAQNSRDGNGLDSISKNLEEIHNQVVAPTRIIEINLDDHNLSKFQRNMIKEYRAQLENGVLSPEKYNEKVTAILNEK